VKWTFAYAFVSVGIAGMQWDNMAKAGVPVLSNWMLDTYCCFLFLFCSEVKGGLS
jgi:hypothetical protein